MTRVLISVRSVAECRTVLSTGTDVIDIKEPARGSLGRPDPLTIRQILSLVGQRRPVSVALGELLECTHSLLRQVPATVTYVKLGLAGCASRTDWRELWTHACRSLPKPAQRVAVVYVDQQRAQAPDWREVLEGAIRLDCRVLLLDTFDKTSGSLLGHLDRSALAQRVTAARDRGLRVALAGSLDVSCLPTVLPLHPDWVAVRGAVCRDGRTGGIDASAVSEFLRVVHAPTEVACDL
jgi:uncharacterized protein (UPF0264 family)